MIRPPTLKVLEKRDAEIKGAWTRFVAAATEHGAGLKRRSDARRAHPHPFSLDQRAGASDVHDREKKILLLMERYENPVYFCCCVLLPVGGRRGLCAQRSWILHWQ